MNLLKKIIFLSFFFLILSPNSNSTIFPDIVFKITDTTVQTGSEYVFLNIYLDNFYDTIAGFEFVLESTIPELVLFDFNNKGYDSAGTLVSGFEFISVRNIFNDGSMLKFQCIADLPFQPNLTPGIPPQMGAVLVKIPLLIASDISDVENYTSVIKVHKPFSFSDPSGRSIGTAVDTTYDTLYWLCDEWDIDSCLSWDSISGSPDNYDSVVYDTIKYGYLDTTKVITYEGSVTVRPNSGLLNCDISKDDFINISDLTCLIAYLFGGYDPQRCDNLQCVTNGNEFIDISTLTYIINYLFNNGPPP